MNDFLVRTPIFSLNKLKDFYESDKSEDFILEFFSENKIFNESIYFYSKILFNEAKKVVNSDYSISQKKKTNVSESLIKYFFLPCVFCVLLTRI